MNQCCVVILDLSCFRVQSSAGEADDVSAVQVAVSAAPVQGKPHAVVEEHRVAKCTCLWLSVILAYSLDLQK